MFTQPKEGEYNTFFGRYVKQVPTGDVRDVLAQSLKNTTLLLSDVTEDQANYRYAPGKWTLKEVLGHMSDTERIMSYRLLRIARGDQTPLPGFDEDALTSGASFNDCSWSDLLEDYAAVRAATLTLLRSLSEDAWSRMGIVSGNDTSARALAYVIAGHELHHLNVIKERYLSL